MNKEFVDGAGLPSPGRWRIRDRDLPGDDVASELRHALREGLIGMEASLPGKGLRAAMLAMAAGDLTENPFPERHLERLRGDIRSILKKHGFSEGLAQQGDADQRTDVRL